MDLFEYQGKQYFARYDIPVSAGDVAVTVDQAVAAADKAGYPVESSWQKMPMKYVCTQGTFWAWTSKAMLSSARG
jgi:succinyl-CoA synthetase beta subunit